MIMNTDFFSMHSKHIFKIYSLQHFAAILVIAVVIAVSLVLISRSSQENKRKFKLFLGWSALFVQILYMLWICSNGMFSLKDSLPLSICSVSLILVFLSIIIRKKIIINLLYFCGFPGTIYALLFPNLMFDFPHFRFFEFFIAHGIILWMVLFYLFIEKIEITDREMLTAYIVTIAYLLCVMFVNEMLRSNYLYLRRKPVFASFFDVFGKYYQIKLFCCLFVFFKVMQLPFIIKSKIKRNSF